MGIGTVAVYSEADRGRLHVELADDAYLVGPGPSADSYLRGDRIVDAALRAGAAAHLASGVPLEDLGPPLDPETLISLDLPEPVISNGVLLASLLYVDSFGNIALNVTRDDVERLGIVSGTRIEIELMGERYYAVMARTFADARPGDVILYEDSYRNMSVAISRGSAARMLHASPGQTIKIIPGV